MLKAAWCTTLIGLLAIAAVPAAAQDSAARPTPPPANPADVGTIDSIIPVLYAVISGPVGAPRQWDRMRTLFHPAARLIPTGCDTAGNCSARVMTPEDYVQRADSLLRAVGFREREIARRTQRYGNIAHVFSTYESYRRDETAPFTRGINSIQLLWDGKRWWIMNVFWDSERPGNPIPAEYESEVR
ncbi:MAG: hypothetical protein M3Y31_09290 [Gemmatimonadota bacterium]|nr:hypothetical protein [Gemmatimonadota bacterium]